MAQETKKYDEDYLNGLIAKAKKSWEGVDVDSFMSELRDEEEQKGNGEIDMLCNELIVGGHTCQLCASTRSFWRPTSRATMKEDRYIFKRSY